MSLETRIEALTIAIQNLQASIDRQTAAPSVPAPAPVVQVPAPAPVVQVAPVMPSLPTFAAPQTQTSAGAVPFNDPKGMIDYVMTAYKFLGPQKGAEIQGVLVGIGVSNINDIKPDQYAKLVAGIEALKAGG